MAWGREVHWLPESVVVTQWLAPGAACAILTWVCLLLRFADKGRLLASRHSLGLALLIVAVTTAATFVTSEALLPHAGRVPHVVVGLAAGGTLVPRRARQDDGRGTVLAVVTLGVALLLDRIEQRLAHDRAEWCDRLLGGFTECWQLDLFAHDLQLHLLDRLRDAKKRKEVEQRFKEVCEHIACARDTIAALDETHRLRAASRLAEGRDPGSPEQFQRRLAFGAARASCARLLALAWVYGRRTSDREVVRLAAACVKHSLDNPTASRAH